MNDITLTRLIGQQILIDRLSPPWELATMPYLADSMNVQFNIWSPVAGDYKSLNIFPSPLHHEIYRSLMQALNKAEIPHR
jgi:hypothetical protein